MISFQSLKLLAASSFLAVCVSLPSHAGVHVNVNVGIGTPGYYGVLPIQGVTPSLWNANPIVAIGAALAGAPIYLTVPDNHRRHWRRYCAEYGACGAPVYFVKRSWYNKHYRRATPTPPPPGPGYAPPPPPPRYHAVPPRHYGAPPPPPPGRHARPKHDRGPQWDHRPPPRGPHAGPRPAKGHDWDDHRGPGRKRGHHKDD